MLFFIFFLLNAKCYAGPGHYECGLHGRFEYCIDDFPGCVVGCHCYPGYYFDTDTKICEPNTKLTQDYRRQLPPTGYNLHGPSGAMIGPNGAMLAPPPPAPPDVAPNAGDNTQDHGDLSDWLYNQFFKTIESQVVNKTNDEEPLKLGTRRSGSGGAQLEPFLTRRHRSRRRKKSKRRRSRKKIARDDDSTDSSSSSESESSSDDSGNLGSWERFEFGPGPSADPPPFTNDPAGHRQIVMYSKKPKPPLPSFIFLPNMQTAFYPPIGLPAPLPMYPMVPVPPIHPGGQSDCPEHDDTTTPAPTQASTTSPPPTTAAAPATTAAPPAPPTAPPPATATPEQKQALRNHNMYNMPPPLRNKLKHRPVYKQVPPSPMDFSLKQYDDLDYDAMFLGDNNFLSGTDIKADKLNDGSNFKYISELIHKDYNATTPRSPPKRDPKRYEQFFGMKPPMPISSKKRQPITPGRLDSTRRRFDPRKNGEDDSYYSSLGKQIAKLIRGLDSEGIREADIKIEPGQTPVPSHPFFSESSFAARTYWERFVRSPLIMRLNNFTRYDDLIASNEELFDLENQVEEATTPPELSLQELENVINTMGTIRNQIHGRSLKNNSSSKLSNSSFNVSLLPQMNARRSHASIKPKIKTVDNTLNVGDGRVIDFLGSGPPQKNLSQAVVKNATELNETNNKTAVRILPGTIHLNTIIHKLSSFYSTIKPKHQTLRTKGKKHHVTLTKVKNSGKRYESEDKPHMIIAGETTYVKSNKYFFDRGTNYEFENWSME